jgi:hypothetical protein
MADEQRYVAYLVRLWRVHHNAELCWRASIENVHTGERHAFADLAALCDFLWATVQDEAIAQSKAGKHPKADAIEEDTEER